MQPYLLVDGPLEDPRFFYIVIDKLRYQFESCGRAVDCLFKIFQVFQAKYPVQAQYLWTLVQKGVYNIHTTYDVTYPNTEHILQTLLNKSDAV